MIKTTLLSITAAMALATAANASIVTLSAGFAGPFAFESDGATRVNNGLMRIGTLTDVPASDAIADIDAVFSEFGTATTSATGGLGNSISNPAGTPFNDQAIYIWIFDTGSVTPESQHGLYTVLDPAAPGTGNPWLYPTHTGSGTDSVTISLSALVSNGLVIPPGAGVRDGNLILAPAIPEPSGAMLAGLAGMLLVLRRRR